jgi:hypothetical protein
MEKGLEDKISDILSSPDDLKKIMNIVGSLGLGKSDGIETEVTEKSSESVDDISDTSTVTRLLSQGKNERMSLLSALKPFLKDDKKEKVDTLIRLLNAAEILLTTKNLL